MFQNNRIDQSLGPWLRKQESNSSYSVTVQAKSSVKVNFPIEDEDYFVEPQDEKEIGMVCQSLAKFKDYIQFHGIEPSDIWQNKEAMQYLVFVDVAQRKLGYKFTSGEILSLKKLSQRKNLSVDSFSRLNLWPKKANSKASVLTSISHKSFQDIKRGSSSTKNLNKNYQTRNSEQKSFVDKQRINKRKNAKMRTTCDQLTNNLLKSRFNEETSKDHKIVALRQDMEMNALEKKWELVVMAGEMNKWIYESQPDIEKENKKTPALFKIVNQGENYTIVRVNDQQQQVIPEVVFYKKYHALKKKRTSTKQIEKKAVSQAIVGILNMCPGKSGSNKLNHRDKQLNESLLHIMRIKNILQHQYRLLTESAINT